MRQSDKTKEILYPRLLLLESSWADSPDQYMHCTKSTARLYSCLSNLSLNEYGPVSVIEKPLLAHRFQQDIAQFADMPLMGLHIVVISAHGSDLFRPGAKSLGFDMETKGVRCIDGQISLIENLRPINEKLTKTLLIIDACRVGSEVASIVKETGVYGCVGFSRSVAWTDSTVFVLALLLNLFEEGVFHGDADHNDAKKVIQSMHRGAYGSLMDSLRVAFAFQKSTRRNGKRKAAKKRSGKDIA